MTGLPDSVVNSRPDTVILPVLIFSDFVTALKVTSFLISVTLFFVGYLLGPYLGANKWFTGFTLM